jgi:hypothetical protein
MVANPFFLANEGNRGVYVPTSSMPANGAGDWMQGHINKMGHFELNSEGKVNQFTMVVDAILKMVKYLPDYLNDTKRTILHLTERSQHMAT